MPQHMVQGMETRRVVYKGAQAGALLRAPICSNMLPSASGRGPMQTANPSAMMRTSAGMLDGTIAIASRCLSVSEFGVSSGIWLVDGRARPVNGWPVKWMAALRTDSVLYAPETFHHADGRVRYNTIIHESFHDIHESSYQHGIIMPKLRFMLGVDEQQPQFKYAIRGERPLPSRDLVI